MLDHGGRVGFGDRREQPGDRCAAEAQPGDRGRGPADRNLPGMARTASWCTSAGRRIGRANLGGWRWPRQVSPDGRSRGVQASAVVRARAAYTRRPAIDGTRAAGDGWADSGGDMGKVLVARRGPRRPSGGRVARLMLDLIIGRHSAPALTDPAPTDAAAGAHPARRRQRARPQQAAAVSVRGRPG